MSKEESEAEWYKSVNKERMKAVIRGRGEVVPVTQKEIFVHDMVIAEDRRMSALTDEGNVRETDYVEALQLLKDAKSFPENYAKDSAEKIKQLGMIKARVDRNITQASKQNDYEVVRDFADYGAKLQKEIDEVKNPKPGLWKRIARASGLEKVSAVILVIGGLLFLSPNITGNAIGTLSVKGTSFMGLGFLVVGLVICSYLIRSRK